jgi:DNA-binding transcriptional LysR family regulator
MRFTLRQLEIFLAIAEQENISRAATQLHMSQSAASAALQQLELNYGINLFERIGKSLKLSSAGRTLRPKAESLIAHSAELHQGFLGQDQAGDLNIGASLTIGNYLAVEYLTRYKSQYPQAKTQYHVASTPEIVEQLLAFNIDIGLVEAEIHHPDIDVLPWREDRMVVFCSKDHPLAQQKNLTDADLLAANWILREPSSGARQTFDRAMAGLKSKLNIYLELTHNEAIKRAVETGIGIGCLSEIALEYPMRRGDLVALDIDDRNMRRNFYFLLHKSRHPSSAVSRWIALCQHK